MTEGAEEREGSLAPHHHPTVAAVKQNCDGPSLPVWKGVWEGQW